MYGLRAVNRMMSEMPFEVLITLLCLFSGLPMALGIFPPPNSILSELPPWAIRCWGSMLSLGGLSALTGLMLSHATKHRRFLEGLYVESAGMFILGCGALVFSLAIGVSAGGRAIFSILVYSVMAASCFFRFKTAQQTIKKMKEAIGIERKHLRGH